jgi:hypothetical protein
MRGAKIYENQGEQPAIKISEERLRGRQSVRTTFRLSEDLIALIGIAAGQFGLKQKSLFDQLIEDTAVLDKVAESAVGYSPDNSQRRPKTFVLSKRSLHSLEMVAAERRISRDALVEVSIRRLLPVVLAEWEKHKKRQTILVEMENFLGHGQDLLAKAEKLLGREDPVYEMIDRMVRLGKEKLTNLADIVARGKLMEKVRVERFAGDRGDGG